MKDDKEGSNPATLLIVEGDPATLIAYQDVLKEAGFQVLTAANGKEAYELYQKVTPDLILSDIPMLEMDGIELLKAIRKTLEGKRIPFVFLTALGTRKDIFVARSLEADGYLTKPVTSSELIAVVRAKLKRFKELREAWQ